MTTFMENLVSQQEMTKAEIIQIIEAKYASLKKGGQTAIYPGDVIRVGYKIQEGEKERIQFSEGLVIAKKNRSLSKTFTLRRNVQGIGIEQIFFCHSPRIDSIVTKHQSKVRRSKLYFIRNLRGKAARLKPKID